MIKGGTMRIRKSNPKLLNHSERDTTVIIHPRHVERYWSCRQMVNHLKDNNLGYWEHWCSMKLL